MPYAKLNATSAQNKTAMQAMAIESLDFIRKKAGLQKQQKGKAVYHRMLSALSYRASRQTLTIQCLK